MFLLDVKGTSRSPVPTPSALSLEEPLVDEMAADRGGVGVALADEQVDLLLRVLLAGLEVLGEHVEHDEPLLLRGRKRRESVVLEERPQHGVGLVVLDRL